jgi:hypothetical protein
MYKTGEYRGESGRFRWAVFDIMTHVWYFPTHYGKKAAERLAKRLNKEAV